MAANDPLPKPTDGLPVTPAEPLGYFRLAAHPMRRTVTFLAWFGLVIGLVDLWVYTYRILNYGSLFEWLLRDIDEPWRWFSILQCVSAMLLAFASIACLRGWRLGRRAMVLSAYLALVLFGMLEVTYFYVRVDRQLAVLLSAEWWLQWINNEIRRELGGLIFPVLILVIFRDKTVRELFEQRLTD